MESGDRVRDRDTETQLEGTDRRTNEKKTNITNNHWTFIKTIQPLIVYKKSK